MARRSSLSLFILAIVGALYWFAPVEDGFVGMKVAPRLSRAALRASAEDYPELTRVEDMIYESCLVKEGAEEVQCLRLWDKLQKFHKESAMECNLDDLRCIVLDVLDRLCSGIEGKNGIVLLSKVANTMEAFRAKFDNWDGAFASIDTDGSGDLSLSELTAAIKKLNIDMTEKEVSLVFLAADANGDGSVSKEEFSNFMTAAVFAEEPLLAMQPDTMPKKQPDFMEYLRMSGTTFA